jgi:Protein of unknown function (DUF2490)
MKQCGRGARCVTGVVAIAFGGMILTTPVALRAETVEDAQLWTTLSASGSIKGDLVGQIDLNIRAGANSGRVNQTLSRGAIGYRLTKSVTVSIGYGHITTYRAGLRDNAEERTYQQVAWTIGKIGKGTLSTRMRLEQRFVRPGTATGWRYRQQIRFALPVDRSGTALLLQAEPFYAFNSTDWGARAGFDQVRVMTGVSIPVSKQAALETGYQVQFVRGATVDRLNHVVPVTLVVRF